MFLALNTYPCWLVRSSISQVLLHFVAKFNFCIIHRLQLVQFPDNQLPSANSPTCFRNLQIIFQIMCQYANNHNDMDDYFQTEIQTVTLYNSFPYHPFINFNRYISECFGLICQNCSMYGTPEIQPLQQDQLGGATEEARNMVRSWNSLEDNKGKT